MGLSKLILNIQERDVFQKYSTISSNIQLKTSNNFYEDSCTPFLEQTS